jgi:DNA-binding XRE family transcriptional regulator
MHHSTPDTLEQERAALIERLSARPTLPPPAARRALRVAAGATLEEVGRTVGVSREAIRRYENGSRTPRGAHAEAYAAVLRDFQALIPLAGGDGRASD